MSGADAQRLIQASLLGEAIDAGPVLVFVADDQMKYVAVNQFACDVLGYERAELLGMTVTDVVRDPSAAADYAEMIAHRTRRGTAELVRRDGSTVPFSYRAGETRVAAMTFYVAAGFVD